MPQLGVGPLRLGVAGPAFARSRSTRGWSIVGSVINGAGDPFVGAIVKIYRTSDDVEIASTISDSTGTYRFAVATNSYFYYVVAYAPGSPDLFATSVNTLTAS